MEQANNIPDERQLVAIPLSVVKGLYKIMCCVPYSMPYEVYDESKPGMKSAQSWILKYGKDNKLDDR
jgi:hypothetical protein